MKKISVIVWIAILMMGCASNIKDGVALLEEGKYEAAAEVFLEEIEEGKNLEEAYRGAGIAYFEQKEYKKAKEYLLFAMDEGAEETATLNSLLGACCLNLEEYTTSLEYYEKANASRDCSEELKQENALQMIILCEKMGDWDQAKEKMKAYQAAYPEDQSVEKEAEFLETR